MPLWHDVCSYPWKSYTNFGVSTRRPDPYPHIGCTSGKPLNNIGGMMLYHPESRLIIIIYIYIYIKYIYIYTYIYIYICVWIYIYHITIQFGIYTSIYRCTTRMQYLGCCTSQVRPPLAPWRRIPAATQWRFWRPGSCSWSNNTYISIIVLDIPSGYLT